MKTFCKKLNDCKTILKEVKVGSELETGDGDQSYSIFLPLFGIFFSGLKMH